MISIRVITPTIKQMLKRIVEEDVAISWISVANKMSVHSFELIACVATSFLNRK